MSRSRRRAPRAPSGGAGRGLSRDLPSRAAARSRSCTTLRGARACGLAIGLALAGRASEARAEVPGGDLDLQAFRPAVDARGHISVNSSDLLGPGEVSFGLVTTWGHRLLELRGGSPADPGYAGGEARYAVEDVVTPTLQGAIGLWRTVEVAATVPFVLVSGDVGPDYLGDPTDPNDDEEFGFSAQGLGDVGLHAKVRLLDTSRHAVGLALVASVFVPAGHDGASWLGEGAPTLQPIVVVDREAHGGRLRLAANGGARIRTAGEATRRFAVLPGARAGEVAVPTTGETVVAPAVELPFGVAAAYGLVPGRFDVVGEVLGAVPLGGEGYLPVEAIAAMKLYLARNSFFLVGAGAGLGAATAGSPALRAFAGVVFEPHLGDRDGDGLKDDVDRCPDEPEDFDDFEDRDGCPEPDNDRDGILDGEDRCPNEPEDRDGVEDEDGCPDPDELDRDGDRLPDPQDACPDDPEDVDGFEDEDGCPDTDNDRDGILDVDDLCIDDPEDRDGWQDEDGCPDPDNDADRILDGDDSCRDEPENYNGVKDSDGCPDRDIAVRTTGSIVILENVYFETNSAVIRPESYPVLDAVAATIRLNPDIARLEIQGHADERGGDEYNLRLTQARAESVRTYLIAQGVEGERLVPKGYGERQPKVEGHSELAWAQNRRVEFIIVEQKTGP